MVLRDTLKNIRKEKGLTQEKMARELNITTRAYQYFEAGKISLAIPRALLLSKILNTPLEILFREDYIKNGCGGEV